MRGFYWADGIHLPNAISDDGEEAFLKMITIGATDVIAPGGNFYIGLCSGGTLAGNSTLATVAATEPVGNGYQRQSILRDPTGWMNFAIVNGIWRAQTQLVNFVASGGDYDKTFTRLFLCNVLNGTVGKLLGWSAELNVAMQLTDGQSYPARYELWAS